MIEYSQDPEIMSGNYHIPLRMLGDLSLPLLFNQLCLYCGGRVYLFLFLGIKSRVLCTLRQELQVLTHTDL